METLPPIRSASGLHPWVAMQPDDFKPLPPLVHGAVVRGEGKSADCDCGRMSR